jgi:hypothetical protein
MKRHAVTHPFKIVTVPAPIEAASSFKLEIETPEFPAAELNGTELSIRDAEGAEVARCAIVRGSDGVHVLAPVPAGLIAPATTGSHLWQAVICRDADEDEGEAAEADIPPEAVPFAVDVAAHTIFVSVWDMPPAVEAGRPFAATIGLKCTCGCDTRGWAFSITDAVGCEVHAGRVGDVPAAGTDALYHARIELMAPADVGRAVWSVAAHCPDHPMPHALRIQPLHLNVTDRAEIALRLRVVDAETGAPVPRAKIVAHPFRTLADESGAAELRVAPGDYRIYASGKGYFASQRSARITDDMELVAELHPDREPTVADAWA